MNSITKIVVSHAPHDLPWGPAENLHGDDVADAIRTLKGRPGRALVAFAGAELATTIVDADLVDEYRLMVHPIVLGDGRALFDHVAAERSLRLVAATPFPSGVVSDRSHRDAPETCVHPTRRPRRSTPSHHAPCAGRRRTRPTTPRPARSQTHSIWTMALRRLGWRVDADVFEPYARAADDLAAWELDHVPPGRSRTVALEAVVVGTVVFEAALIALRRLAEEHHSALRFAQHPDAHNRRAGRSRRQAPPR